MSAAPGARRPRSDVGLVAAATRVAGLVPDALFTRLVAAGYVRFEAELSRLPDLLPARPGPRLAVDVGAWYGPWTRRLSGLVERVLAVEPNPAVARVLDRTTPASVRVVQAAAGDLPGRTTLWVPGTGRGSEGVAGLQQRDGFAPVEVDRVRLDDVLAAGPRPPVAGEVALVKVDVEGFELEVLRGAERTLTEHRPVVVVELEHHRSDVGAAVAHLSSLGYDAEVLVDDRWTPLTGYDLAAHQARLQPLVGERSLLHRIARPLPRYVNNVVFRPRP